MLGNRLRPAKTCAFIFVFLQFAVLQGLSSAPAYGGARPDEQQRQALGSLITMGDVYLNDAAAPAESTIFAGDTLRSSGTGTGTFTLIGKGSFRIFPNTEIVFAGGPQYAAELKSGRVVMSSLNGATGINLRAGSSVVVAVAEGEQSVSNIEAPSDGSFVVSCLGGSVGIIPLAGGKGIFIRMGQSANISAAGELSPVSHEPPATNPQALSSTSSNSEEPAPAGRQKRSYMRWVLIGAGVAGAGIAAAVLASNGSRPVSSAATLFLGPPTAPTSSSSPPPSDPAPPITSPAPPANPVPAPPPPPPTPPGHDCHDPHDKKCTPHVVLGLAFHF